MPYSARMVRDGIVVHTDLDAPVYVEPVDYEAVKTEVITDEHYESEVLDRIRSNRA